MRNKKISLLEILDTFSVIIALIVFVFSLDIILSRWISPNVLAPIDAIILILGTMLLALYSPYRMKWIGISGGWRKTNQEIENKVREIVRKIMKRGDGIVSGGALGVDFIALDEALKYDLKAERIKIFLPTTLEKYAEHLKRKAREGVVKSEKVKALLNQLRKLKEINPKALIENPDTNFTEETKKKMYYQRNTKIVEASDELIAFRIKTKESEGLGTLDTINKAKEKGIPVKVFEFILD